MGYHYGALFLSLDKLKKFFIYFFYFQNISHQFTLFLRFLANIFASSDSTAAIEQE